MTELHLSSALAELTETQAAAVAWQEGPLFLLAGPGSGKTRVLTTRVARILAESADRSFRVLALTFTNKAADEMAARVTELVPGQERRALIGTFHSFCMQMLQQHGSHLGIKPDFAIYSLESDRQEALRDAIRRNAELDESDVRYLAHIDRMKARLIQPEGCSKYFKEPAVGRHVETVYAAYEAELARANALDFGSLIARSHQLITQFPGVAMRYRKAYAYWMFDEFQDTTDGQYRLIKALAGDDFKNIFAVADDDQIIYQWNGASYQQIQRFRTDFQPEELQLPTNYRCPPSIVAAANRLVVHNKHRTSTKRPLEAGKTNLRYDASEHIQLRRFLSDEEEAYGVALSIAEFSPELRGETAVLARTRAQLEKTQARLHAAGVASVIAQRRDDFRSPPFLWLSAALRQVLRPMDRRAFEALVGAFNRWFDTDLRYADLLDDADLSARSFLEEWADAVHKASANQNALALAELALKYGREPLAFRKFIDAVLEQLPVDEEDIDIAEDRSAWSDLTRSIGQTVGREAPLEQFLQELALRSKEPPIGPRTVTLMTIHGAKGKEFDHVYLVGLAEQVLPSFQSLKAGEASHEMEEERRNCFVGITRARECLRLSYADRYRNWPKSPSRFLEEMELTLPAAPEPARLPSD